MILSTMAPGVLADATPPSSPQTKAAKELKGPHLPIPEVKAFDASTTTVDELVDAIKVAGGVVVRNMLTREETSQIEKDVRPWLDKDKPWDGM